MSEYTPLAERVGDLFDYAVAHPDGFTYVDVENDLGWDRGLFSWVARNLRAEFADDSVNLICEPQGQYEPWLYRLVGTADDARIWSTNRIADLEGRLHTMASVSESVKNATDGRTTEGRKARKINRTLVRLIEDLEDIANGA